MTNDDRQYFEDCLKSIIDRLDKMQDQIDKLSEKQTGSVVVSKTENTTWPIQGDDYYWICYDGVVDADIWANSRTDKEMRAIGNCFRTEEEANLVIKKLKALKRLRDNGFKFDGYEIEVQYQGGARIKLDTVIEGELCTLDLDLLFGGEVAAQAERIRELERENRTLKANMEEK